MWYRNEPCYYAVLSYTLSTSCSLCKYSQGNTKTLFKMINTLCYFECIKSVLKPVLYCSLSRTYQLLDLLSLKSHSGIINFNQCSSFLGLCASAHLEVPCLKNLFLLLDNCENKILSVLQSAQIANSSFHSEFSTFELDTELINY